MNPIYLDYAASTPVLKSVEDVMIKTLLNENLQGNPSSNHFYGWSARDAIIESRKTIANSIGGDYRDIVFTSGATEANNIVIQGAIEKAAKENNGYSNIHVITSSIEHKSVLDVFAFYEEKGVNVTYVQPNHEGIITSDAVESHLTLQTVFVSIMFVNNEVGNKNDVVAIAKCCRDYSVSNETNVNFHTDATQGIGKLPFSLKGTFIDYTTFSSHKIYGPKGIGAISFNNGSANNCAKTIFGGPQERGFKPGTQPTHQIVGFAKACEELTQKDRRFEAYTHYLKLTRVFVKALCGFGLEFTLNTNLAKSSPNILNINIPGIESDLLMGMLSTLSVSAGSACNSKKEESSYVVNAIQKARQQSVDDISTNLRISWGIETPNEVPGFAAKEIHEMVTKYKEITQ